MLDNKQYPDPVEALIVARTTLLLISQNFQEPKAQERARNALELMAALY